MADEVRDDLRDEDFNEKIIEMFDDMSIEM